MTESHAVNASVPGDPGGAGTQVADGDSLPDSAVHRRSESVKDMRLGRLASVASDRARASSMDCFVCVLSSSDHYDCRFSCALAR